VVGNTGSQLLRAANSVTVHQGQASRTMYVCMYATSLNLFKLFYKACQIEYSADHEGLVSVVSRHLSLFDHSRNIYSSPTSNYFSST
jgi:hypothetical protein